MHSKVFNIAKNKYIIASLIFVVWVGFIDSDHNFFRHQQLKNDIHDRLNLKIYYEEQIEYNKNIALKLETDIDFVEKFAREEYGFKKDDEVVYTIIPD
jgi:cell division protein DivIC